MVFRLLIASVASYSSPTYGSQWEYTGTPPTYGSQEKDLCTGFLHDNCLEECKALHRCQRPVVALSGTSDVEFDGNGKATSNGDALRARVKACEPASQVLQDCMKEEHFKENRQMYVNLVFLAIFYICSLMLYKACQNNHINDKIVDEELELMKEARTGGRTEGPMTVEGEELVQKMNGHSFEGTYVIDGGNALSMESALYSVNVESSGRVHGDGEHPEDGFFSLEGHLWRDGSNKIAWREAYDKHVFRGKSLAETLVVEFVGRVNPETLHVDGVWLMCVDSRGSLSLDKAAFVVDKAALEEELVDQELKQRHTAQKVHDEDVMHDEQANNGAVHDDVHDLIELDSPVKNDDESV